MPSLTVLSNRLPIRLQVDNDTWRASRSDGGLVAALDPVLSKHGGRWIGWSGVCLDSDKQIEAMQVASEDLGYNLIGVPLSETEVARYYEGYSNGVLWPLFHGFKKRCDFDSNDFVTYREVCQRFAQVTAGTVPETEAIWIHDYQLMAVAPALRRLGHTGPLGFFLHIPFPPLEDFVCLPQREELLMALLEHNLVGFQTTRDRDHFAACVEHLAPQCSVVKGEKGNLDCIYLHGRRIWFGAFPIGIDPTTFEELANSPAVITRTHDIRTRLRGRKLLLGVDRLDYSKGLIERLKAFERVLQRRPEASEEVLFCQITVPSREAIPAYQAYRRELEELVGHIQGKYGSPVTSPICYIYGRVDMYELTAMYRAADVALVTPLRDGMNLVAKEFCAAQVDEAGVLVLSEMAGAAAQLQDDAILTNPHSIEATADAIEQALQLSSSEKARRMRHARQNGRDSNVFHWASSFLKALREPTRVTAHAPRASYRPHFTMPARGSDRASAGKDLRHRASDSRPGTSASNASKGCAAQSIEPGAALAMGSAARPKTRSDLLRLR